MLKNKVKAHEQTIEGMMSGADKSPVFPLGKSILF
jgi:hypothetical protein